MKLIHVLDKITVDKIAAGEVIERPASALKELIENSIDAGATAITVEIKGGGIDLIRVTDNGSGIEKEDVPTAFLSHATSKLKNADDLFSVSTLGFRGEAIPSIASVAKVEVITRCENEVYGRQYIVEGAVPSGDTEIGAPKGTTFFVRDLFYNTPARRKFLKSQVTEGSYIGDMMEKLALSHPEIGFTLINNGTVKLKTSGNGRLKDVIFTIYGKQTLEELIETDDTLNFVSIKGCLGKPVLSKGSRSFETLFVNGRYVKCPLIYKAIEEAYAPFMMQHRFPFTVLNISLPSEEFDVNVHPSKLELRFRSEAYIFDTLVKLVRQNLLKRELVSDTRVNDNEKEKPYSYSKKEDIRQAFETLPEKREVKKEEEFTAKSRDNINVTGLRKGNPVQNEPETTEEAEKKDENISGENKNGFDKKNEYPVETKSIPEVNDKACISENKTGNPEKPGDLLKKPSEPPEKTEKNFRQSDFFEEKLISDEGIKKYRLIGQVFDTYWIIEMNNRLYIMDQHAAHEKVLFEKKMKELSENKVCSQMLNPGKVISLTQKEEVVLNTCIDEFENFGFKISAFGGREYLISAVPQDLYGINPEELFKEVMAELSEELTKRKPEIILSKIASASCKAAIKGNMRISFAEADILIKSLLELENPYNCPHGRPVLISLSKQELEKKFKRIL